MTTPQHLRDSDQAAGFDIGPDFERFNQMNDVFTRAFWDDTVLSADIDAFFASYRMEAAPRRGEGFNQRDFALRNASWLISDIISNRAAEDGLREGFQGAIRNDTPVAADRVTLRDPQFEAADHRSRYALALYATARHAGYDPDRRSAAGRADPCDCHGARDGRGFGRNLS